MKRKSILLLARTVAGIALLALLVAWIGIEPLRENLTRFHPLYYLVALALIFVHYFLQSVILRILLRTKGTLVRAREVCRLMIISNFFGVFLPGGTGPDIVLCYNMVRSTEKKEYALSAVIFIRIAVLFIMALIAFAFSFHPVAPGRRIQWLTGGIVMAFVAYFIVMANRNTLKLARLLLNFLNRHHWTSLLYKTYFALSEYGRDRSIMPAILPLCVVSAVIKIVTDYFIALSLGLDIPLLYFFVFIPVITLIAAIPLTFAGLGVREGSFVGFFALAGVPATDALAVSLVSFTLVIWTAVAGAILYALGGARLATREETAGGGDR